MFTTFIKMETFFMNTKNSKTNESHRFKYDLIDKLDLKNPNKDMVLGSLSIRIRMQMQIRIVKMYQD